jgi:hypothetical protein
MEGIQYTCHGTCRSSGFEQGTGVKIGWDFQAGWAVAGVEPMGWRRAPSKTRAIPNRV